jgi:DNA-binding transcriptional LysR family regulator
MDNVTIAQLEAFYWTVELGSVHRAAVKLKMAQPTISLRLRQLEAEVGTQLLERSGRGLRITRDGNAFLTHAKLVLDAYRQMRTASAPPSMIGTIRIGLAEGFAVACLPPLIPILEREFPLLRPEWTVSTSSGLEQGLIKGTLDLAVVVNAVGHRNIRLTPIGAQKTVWAAASHFEVNSGASPYELSKFRIVTTPPPTSMYRTMIGWFALENQQPGPLCVCSSVIVAAQLVAAGLGIGAFPARMIEAYRAAGNIVAIASDPPLEDGRVYVADRTMADQNRTAAIIRVLEEMTQSIGYFDTNV